MQHQYADLGRKFALPTLPEKIQKPEILLWNLPLAEELGLKLSPPEQAQYFTGQQLFEGSKPVAMAYAGHQFGHFNPQLGDGRAHLLGELENAEGQIKELHLKGSGRTPFSRNGDGKCAIKPAVREYIMSEALFALGVPTTRTLAVVITNQELFRQQPTTGAVVTRVASSHIRVGTFEYFAARGLHTELKQLVDLTISRHYPHIDLNNTSKYINLLSHVIDKHIELVVNWMRVGFIHGVMNTDNTLLSGETIDYGPCAMLGAYDPATVFSSIDDLGRYAFGNQPNIIHWNLARFAECLIPLMGDDQQKAIDTIMPVLDDFAPKFKSAYNQMMANKLGLNEASTKSIQLADELLSLMQQHRLDYTQSFSGLFNNIGTSQSEVSNIHPKLKTWKTHWLATVKNSNQSEQVTKQLLQKVNPVVIPRNHHIEAILSDVEKNQQITEQLSDFLKVLQSPYNSINSTALYQDSAPDYDSQYQTFCGT
jgi:uncharacterized protein YdiU (UPF0061 family)